MNEMKLIMEGWNRYRLIENIEKLKQEPPTTVDFIQKLSKTTDRHELQGVLTALLRDPEVKSAAELVVKLEDETKKKANQETEPGAPGPLPTTQEEGVLQDFGLAVGAHAFVIAQSPTFQKLVKYGGPIIALAMIVKALSGTGTVQSVDLVKGAVDLVQASSQADVADGLELAMGLADVVAEKQREV